MWRVGDHAHADPVRRNSVDLHLGAIDLAKVWDVDKAIAAQKRAGGSSSAKEHVLDLGDFDYDQFSETCLIKVESFPTHSAAEERQRKVYSIGDTVYIKPMGFMLWQTEETVSTPKENTRFISFVNAKSRKARTGIVVHLTAPTINSAWGGSITLEIVNLGPFTFSLKPGDAIAQLTVATISSPPDPNYRGKKKSQTDGQGDPSGRPRRT